MADWRDVMTARSEADTARNDVDAFSGRLEENWADSPALATMLATKAICLELRALGMIIDHVGAK